MLFSARTVLFALTCLSYGYCEYIANGQWIKFDDFNVFTFKGPPRTDKLTLQLAPEYKLHGEPAVLEYQTFDNDTTACMNFKYYLRTPDEYGLKLIHYSAETKTDTQIWARYGSETDIWRTAEVVVSVKSGDKLKFVGRTVSGHIALNDVNLDYSMKSCRFPGWDTDFENDENKSWIANIVNASSQHARDHSSNSGSGKVAFLYNGKIQPRESIPMEAKCFTFWFYRPKSASQPTEFWVDLNSVKVFKTYDERMPLNEWLRVQVPLTPLMKGRFNTLQIQTNDKTSMTRAGVLFDDLSFSDRECDKPVNCIFDDNTCGWTHVVKNDHSLTWNLGPGRVQDYDAYRGGIVPLVHPALLYTDFTVLQPKSGIEIQSEFLLNPGVHCAIIDVVYNRIDKNDAFILSQITQSFTFSESLALWALNSMNASKLDPKVYYEERFEVRVPGSNRPRRLGFYALSANPVSRMGVKSIYVREGECKPEDQSPTEGPFVPSKLDGVTLYVADELFKNARTNTERVLELIKINDPIKDATINVLHELADVIRRVERNIENTK